MSSWNHYSSNPGWHMHAGPHSFSHSLFPNTSTGLQQTSSYQLPQLYPSPPNNLLNSQQTSSHHPVQHSTAFHNNSVGLQQNPSNHHYQHPAFISSPPVYYDTVATSTNPYITNLTTVSPNDSKEHKESVNDIKEPSPSSSSHSNSQLQCC